MYVGAHGQADSLETLLDAAQIIQTENNSNIRFVLIGDGAEKTNLIDYKNKIGLKNTEFRDPVDKNAIPNILENADAVVSLMKGAELYRYGISSNKEFDYAASGKPIILSGDPINNIVLEAKCGLSVPPDNAQALAAAILELSGMKERERKELGQNGRKFVEANHSIPVLADRFEHVFGELKTR